MMEMNGIKMFGLFKGMQYEYCDEEFDDYRNIKNSLKKSDVIQYIQSLSAAISPKGAVYDIISGEELKYAGMYNDGNYSFPTDFLHYYENYDIGIPPEYEEYLINEKGLIPEES